MLIRYNSMAEIRAEYINSGASRRIGHSNSSWYGHETAAQTLIFSETGDTRLVPQAESLLVQLDQEIDVPRRAQVRCVAGGWPDVPAAISGFPLSMRRMEEINDDRSPISIYVNGVSSGGVNATTLTKRGVAVLALVMALSRVRPVELHYLSTLQNTRDKDGETIFDVRINTTPLDLASACYTLTSQGFTRRLTYQLGYAKYNFAGGWPKKYSYRNPRAYQDYLRSLLGLNPATSLIIDPVELHDLIVKEPLLWVQNQVDYFTNKFDEREIA
jgi:hypothetical protein